MHSSRNKLGSFQCAIVGVGESKVRLMFVTDFNLMRHFNLNFQYGGDIRYFTFYCLSDLHLGTIVDEKLLDTTVREIDDNPLAFWFGGGDMIEAINHKDHRFDIDTIAPWVGLKDPIGSEIEYVYEKLKKIAHKGLGLIEGNHEYTASRDWVRDVHQTLCTKLDLRSFGPAATLNLIFRRGEGANRGGVVTFPGLIAHGTSGASKTNMVRSLAEPLSMFDVYSGIRFCLMGHTHDSNSILFNREFVDINGRKSKKCLAARMGGLMKYMGYSQRKLYKPIQPSIFKFYISPSRDMITTNLGDITERSLV